MSYIDAIYDRDNHAVKVVERVNGDRVERTYPVTYQFFIEDKNGLHKSIYHKPLSRIKAKSYSDFRKKLHEYSKVKKYESDLKPVNVCLSENYMNADVPNPHVVFFDIETGFQRYAYRDEHMVKMLDKNIRVFDLARLKNRHEEMVFDHVTKEWVPVEGCRYLELGSGFSEPSDADNPITAISMYLQWLNLSVCLAVPPLSMTFDEAKSLLADMPHVVLYRTEKEMLLEFLQIIDDGDILSGWNSKSYDIPYMINRMKKLIPKDLNRICLWNQSPKKREFEKYGKVDFTYELSGRIHLDYMDLYIKYNYEERSSYSLDAIGEYELGERKVEYKGTLSELYENDFRLFVEYAIQDTALLNKLDLKLKFIELANFIAHTGTVLIPATMGAVALSEQAIINEAHSLGLRLPDKKVEPKNSTGDQDYAEYAEQDDSYDIIDDDNLEFEELYRTKAAGAYVAYPKIGLHDDVGSLDVNSLYPSNIRALNMSTETIHGQVRQERTDAYILGKMKEGSSFADAWEGLFGSIEYQLIMDKSQELITIDWEADGSSTTMTAEEAYNLFFTGNKPYVMSANGTIFSLQYEGVIPGLLTKWYAQRKEYQANLKKLNDLETGIVIPEDMLSFLNKLL